MRALAAEAELPVASKADSQDLCFLAGTGRAAFLARHGGARERPGEIVDRGGRVLGRHRGHHGFTVGQRKGIGLAAPEPLYVLATDARANTVTVGARADLLTHAVQVRGARLHRPGREVDAVRLRYRSRPLPCTVDRARARAGRRCTSPSRPTARRRARPLAFTQATLWSAPATIARRAHGDRGARARASSIRAADVLAAAPHTMSPSTEPPQPRCSVSRGGPSGA